MTKRRTLTIAGTAVVAVTAWVFFEGTGDPSSDLAGADSTTTPTSGMVIQIDPETGQPVDPSQYDPNVLPGTQTGINSTSDEGRVEEPAPGGGIMKNLEGRFQNSAVATVSDSDTVEIECVPGKHGHVEETEDAPKKEAGAKGGEQ